MATYTKAARRTLKSSRKAIASYGRSVSDATDRVSDRQAGNALGLVSVAIGLTEVLACRGLARFMGLSEDSHGIFRALGVREIGHGVDLLSHDDPTDGVYARCAGDALDSALLGAAFLTSRRKSGVAAIFALVLPVVAADLLLAGRLARKGYQEEEEDWL